MNKTGTLALIQGALLMLGISTQALASIDLSTTLKRVQCYSMADDTIKQWDPGPKSWESMPFAGDPGTQTYKSPTSKFGLWLELFVDESHQILKALRVTPNATLKVTWTGVDCKVEQSLITRVFDQKTVNEGISDPILETEIAHGNAGILYTWSPGMPLSVKAIPEIEKIAHEMNLKLIPILDASMDERAAKRSIQKLGLGSEFLKKNQSIEVIYRGLTNHYPSLIVFNHGKFTSPVFSGYKTSAVFSGFIKEHL